MALLKFDDGTTYSNPETIAQILAPLGIHWRHFDPGVSLLFPKLSEQDILTESEKRQILELHDSVFEFIKQEGHYLWSDLLNVHPGSHQIHSLMTTYDRYHVHTAPEALYVLAGEAIFGFVRADGHQIQLLVQAQEYIRIPTGIEHWFSLAASLQFKAVRYFTTVKGWVPQYTRTAKNSKRQS